MSRKGEKGGAICIKTQALSRIPLVNSMPKAGALRAMGATLA